MLLNQILERSRRSHDHICPIMILYISLPLASDFWSDYINFAAEQISRFCTSISMYNATKTMYYETNMPQ
jgi:hypothetical protein